MMTQEGHYEYYRCVQHDFTEACKLVNRYLTDLYVLPKKFIDTTGPALDKYIKEYSFPESGSRYHTPFELVLEFIEQLDDFTENTVQLYKEHKLHSDRSKAYMKKVAELNEKNTGRIVSEYAVDYVKLTPEVIELRKGLKHIKEKADEMVDKLERLELRWESIRLKVVA